MIPADTLGLSPELDPTFMALHEKYLMLLEDDDPKNHPANVGKLSWYSLAIAAIDVADICAQDSYLLGQWDECRVWSKKLCASTLYYFFGSWKSQQTHDDGKINEDRWFGKEPALDWCDYLRSSLCWSGVFRSWELTDALMKFPREEVCADSDGHVQRAFYLGLAKWWRNSSDMSWIEDVKNIRGSGCRGFHILCDACRDISISDNESLTENLNAFVRQFIEKRDHDEQFPLDASFLINVARRIDLECDLDAGLQNTSLAGHDFLRA